MYSTVRKKIEELVLDAPERGTSIIVSSMRVSVRRK